MWRVLARSVEMWDPLTDRWTEKASLLERRGKLGLVTTDGGDILALAGVSGFRQTDMLGATNYDVEQKLQRLQDLHCLLHSNIT